MSAHRIAGLLALVFLLSVEGRAGGPLVVGGDAFSPAVQGKPLVWDTSTPVKYRTPDLGALGKLDNASAVARVQALFQVWQDVKTANISFQREGNILSAGAYTGGPVNSAAKFNDVDRSCAQGIQSPIVFDTDGSLFTALGLDPDVIGFAGPCAVDPNTGRITAAEAVLNGKWIDNNAANGELNDRQFDETFVHEFGHFIGLDHSQISLVVLSQPVDQCNRSDLEILPVMFPFAHCQARLDEGLPPLAPDDEAWISMLYPETVTDPPGPSQTHIRFDSVYGIITGKVFFGDGVTPAQGFNLLARDNNSSNNRTFSVVSGYLFTASLGQSVSGTNDLGSAFGSRDLAMIGTYSIPALPGTFTVSAEAIFDGFVGGSSVGPLFPIHLPGGAGAPPVTVTVTAGSTPATANDTVFTDQLPRFDQFEGR
jgi:hypothetical protein